MVESDKGEKKKLRVLVDTGAEVNLIRTNLFSEENFELAAKPITLVTVSGDRLGGGQMWGKFTIALSPLEEKDVHVEGGHSTPIMSGMFYEADIAWDAIVGYPLLSSSRVGIFPHLNCLTQDMGDGKFRCIGGIHVENEDIEKKKARDFEWCDYAVNQEMVNDIINHFQCRPTVDAFATSQNRRFPRYWSRQDSAWEKDWSKEPLIWCNPPFRQLERVVNKFITDQARGILIAPQRDQPWWPKLMDITVDLLKLPEGESIFDKGGLLPQPPPSWPVYAFFVDGSLAELVDEPLKMSRSTWPDMDESVFVSEVVAIMSHHGILPSPTWELVKSEKLVASVVRAGADGLTGQQKEIIEEKKSLIMKEFGHDVLSGKLVPNPPVRGPYGEARIELLPGAAPKRARAFQLQGERGEALKKTLEEFQNLGWIEVSYSDWGSPAFMVPKKVQGEWRMVVDYRALNTVTRHDSYNLPLVETLLQQHREMKIFTVLDMKKGYHQMPLAESSRPYTAMSTPYGLWQWKVMPMGAKNGNAAFQRMMEWVLKDFDFAWPFVDDVIIASRGENMDQAIAQHAKDVHAVLEKFREVQLVCDLSKAQLFQTEVEFCGHTIGHGKRRL